MTRTQIVRRRPSVCSSRIVEYACITKKRHLCLQDFEKGEDETFNVGLWRCQKLIKIASKEPRHH